MRAVGPGQGLPVSLPVGSVSLPEHPGVRRGHGPLGDWGLGVSPWWVPSFPVAWQPPQMIFLLAGCFLEALVPSVGWVLRSCPVPVPRGWFSPGWSLAVPWGSSAGTGWVPGPSARAQGSWVEQVTAMVVAVSPEGQRVAPASCRDRQRRGAGSCCLPRIPPGAGHLQQGRREYFQGYEKNRSEAEEFGARSISASLTCPKGPSGAALAPGEGWHPGGQPSPLWSLGSGARGGHGPPRGRGAGGSGSG